LNLLSDFRKLMFNFYYAQKKTIYTKLYFNKFRGKPAITKFD